MTIHTQKRSPSFFWNKVKRESKQCEKGIGTKPNGNLIKSSTNQTKSNGNRNKSTDNLNKVKCEKDRS